MGRRLVLIDRGNRTLRNQMRGALRDETAKYPALLEACNQRGKRTLLFPIDVGAGRFCAQCVCRLMSAVGSTDRDRQRTIRKLRQADQWSSWLWLRRERQAAKRAAIDIHTVATVAPPSRDIHGSGAKH
ncbi:hypothetical protein DPMN_052184 [Dreissena polymorpha]|uniref:Uncharacterized protein n=1 Tax=Dreissena polymorpha TaxID=45954 RepID=A0A9D4CKZ5_DREPO|nr:hypothetical protein DPMN_052184 [Dreissena polymorpha]